jgi:dihydrofolate synthase / folylpolyglutamate synthase
MDFALAERILQASQHEGVSRRHPGRLDRMRVLLTLLGDPQRAFPSIHVGGTAGKGSTASMCAAIFTASGFKVGLHTKPHMRSVTERARIDGAAISEDRFGELMGSMLPAIEEMEAGEWGRPSYFELLVALTFRYFAEEHVDLAVVEVGIGGTLDGTNVLEPLVSVLTNVGFDHTEVLGDTIEAIATDKAGIIKQRTPVVTAAHGEALRIIEAAAHAKHAPLVVVQQAAEIVSQAPVSSYSQTFSVVTPRRRYDVIIPLLGEFQILNTATALIACEQIEQRFPFSVESAATGLAALSLPGRMEFHPSRPSLLFDVAHNAEKAAALAAALLRHFPDRRFVFVVAISESKDAAAMLDAWAALPAQWIFTTFDVSHRAAMPQTNLSNIAQSRGLTARAVGDPIEALSVARRIAGAGDLVVVTGSTFLVAALRDWFLENAGAYGHAQV